MKFINREKQIKYLNNHFESEPNSLLFVYGPKSSGKSTLLDKVARELDKEKYAINFLDLRRVVIYDFKTFLNVFFPKKLRGKFKDILGGVTFNTGFFSVKIEEEASLKENAFAVIVEKLESAKARGIQPVIIIDEIQLLKHIYINSERYLIDELFNLFIALTKVTHLAHVVLATSDSYFIEEIYNSARLSKTSEFLLLDHFEKKDIVTWLRDERFTEDEIETAWEYIGGCPWEIQHVIKKKKHGQKVEDICHGFVKTNFLKISDYIFPFESHKEDVFFKVINKINKNGYCKKESITQKQVLLELLNKMISHDFWFYNAEDGRITANSKSIYHAFKKMIKERRERVDEIHEQKKTDQIKDAAKWFRKA
jgi:uncharacterized protein